MLYFESSLCSPEFGNCQAEGPFLIAGLLRAFINNLCCILNLREEGALLSRFCFCFKILFKREQVGTHKSGEGRVTEEEADSRPSRELNTGVNPRTPEYSRIMT